jgi:hypothetical protein
MVRLPLVAASLAVPFRVVIHDDAAAKADFPGLFLFHHSFTGIAVFDRDYVFNA